MNRFGIQRPLSKKKCFLILSLLPLYFIVVGLFMQPVDQIFRGIVEIIREPDFLITDYFVIGGVGAAFINAGVLTLICIGIMYALDMNFDGHTVTSTCLMFGFSLFGKNLLNIWMILVGVFLYARYHKTTVKYPCAFFSQGLFSLQRRICRWNYCDRDRIHPEILWRNH